MDKIVENRNKLEKLVVLTIKKYFSKKNVLLIKKLYYFFRRVIRPMYCKLYAYNLTKLALFFGTDKAGHHHYTKHYENHFKSIRNRKMNILEIGVGGHNNPVSGGHSLRMWKSYFPNSIIHSIDIYEKSELEEKRIKIYQGSQADDVFLKNLAATIGSFDIIIDDGSHINSHVLTSFKVLFPFLKNGGIYVIEDTHTSYWPKKEKKSGIFKEFGGDSENFNNLDTIMGFFKSLIDGLNHQEFLLPGYKPNYFDKNIVSFHFYHNLIFIYKDNNDEESIALTNNDWDAIKG